MAGRPRLPVAPCKFCNRKFKRQEHLSRHLRTHTRERPFGCSCGQMFSRQDLLNRHRRLSQCSNPTNTSHLSEENGDDRPIESSYPVSANVPIATPRPQSNTVHGQISSLPFMVQSGAAFLLDEQSDSQAETQPPEADRINQKTPTTSHSGVSADHSQEQLMGRFSVHDLPINQHGKSPSGVSCSSGATAHNCDMNLTIQMDTDLMQPLPFDLNFLPNESGMISDYLTGLFPHINDQHSMMEDTSGCFAPIEPWPSTSGFDKVESSIPPQNILSPSQVHPVSVESHVVPPRQRVATQRDQEQHEFVGSLDAIDDIVATNPWVISTTAYKELSAEVRKHENVLPEPFTLPSRQSLSRFIASWIRGFHPHLPFIHLPTTSLDSMSPMLLLTLAATGSFYGFEHTHGYAMYVIAKSIIIQTLEERRRRFTMHLLRRFPRYAGTSTSSTEVYERATPSTTTSQPGPPSTTDIELLQALLVLVLTMSWLDVPLTQDALSISSQLATLTREAMSWAPVQEVADEWVSWGRKEERQRTILSACFVLNIQTICFNVPPQIPISKIDLPLPCSEAFFKAPNAKIWHQMQREHNPRQQPGFQSCLKKLLSGQPLASELSITEFGNYMLIQSILIQIYVERHAASTFSSSFSSLSADVITRYNNALGAWQSCWDSAIESAIDPSSTHGPLAFNSTAIFRLAHIHLGVDLQSHCELLSREPKLVAQAFEPNRNPVRDRSPHLDGVVLQAICALRIPIRVGIAFVARGRTGHWSVQHAISNFGCALLLTHWLENMFCLVSSGGLESLRPEERRLLSTIERLVEETHLESSLGPKDLYPSRIRRLSIAALRLWAETCIGIQVFEIVHAIGETLSFVAESIESKLEV